MKQTATNYLIDQLELKVMAQHLPRVAEILDKAREMEHEQMDEAYYHGIELSKSNLESIFDIANFNDYYNETYGIED